TAGLAWTVPGLRRRLVGGRGVGPAVVGPDLLWHRIGGREIVAVDGGAVRRRLRDVLETVRPRGGGRGARTGLLVRNDGPIVETARQPRVGPGDVDGGRVVRRAGPVQHA